MDSQTLERISDQLAETGRCIWPGFISAELARALREDLAQHQAHGAFKRAGVGQAGDLQVLDSVRRDEVFWLTPPGHGPAQAELWSRIGQIQAELNQSLFLGLREFEGHYAAYPAGGFYRRHRDVFARDDARMVSLVIYLNPDWQPEHGGQLRMHAPQGVQDVEPREGTLVLFLSRELDHEVLPSQAPRLSFTGWYKTAVKLSERR